MRRTWISLPVFLLIQIVWLSHSAVLHAQDAAAELDRAIAQFDAGDYLAAQETLANVNRSQLSPDQQTRRDDYVNRVQTAITMLERARRDLEDASRALEQGDKARADELIDMVLANTYASPPIRESASSLRRQIQNGSPKQGTVVVQPEPMYKPAGTVVIEPARPEPSGTVIIQAQPVEPPARPVEVESARIQPVRTVTIQPAPAQPVTGTVVVERQSELQPIREVSPPPITARVITPEDNERARTLTAEGNERIAESRYDEARAKFEQALDAVPGYPEANDGLRIVREHQANISGAAVDSLSARIAREDLINWQRTVAEYRDVEGTIRRMMTEERFEEARQLLVRADQIVEAGRQFASPLSVYESLRAEADALAALVEESERNYNERRVAEVRRQIEEQRAERIRQDEENRREQVEKLMDQACQHKDDGDLDAAIVVLNQIVVIDPKYKPARWMIDNLEELRANRRGRSLRDEFYKQSRDTLNLVEEAKIPWADLLRYPKNWPEIISRPERGGRGMSVRTSSFLTALESPVPVRFDREPLEQVIERLASAQNLNVIVKWHDLQRVGVSAEMPITLKVPNEISLKRALTEVLDQAGAGGAIIGYEVTDEAIVIATRDTLDRNTHQVVYDINDLLMEVPNFNDAPMPDLADATRKNVPRAEKAQSPWNGEKSSDAPEDPMDLDRRRRVAEIIQLIQDNVAPHSWRDRGGTVGHISEINGQLVITQNSSAQRAIGDLLGKLREQRAIQIAVEARFITVSSHYLEELGMDLDIILNSGNAGFDFIPGASGPLTDPVLGNALLLPRSFSRLGFTPNTPALGTGTARPGAVNPVPQPYGQPFLVPQQQGGGGSQMSPVPMVNRISQFTDPANLGSDVPGSFAGQQLPPALSIFGSFLDNIQVDFLIRATQADSRTTVLTAPQLVLFNGQRSWVAVTIQQNFVSQLNPVVATGAVAQAPVTGTIDSGAVLDVNATVTADKRYVTMTLRPGVTRLLDLQTIPFSGGGAGGGFGGGTALNAFIQLPTLSSQRVQTTVSVPDGGTLLIGGQKLASETEVEAGVPILSKIPILKRAYNSRSMVKDEQTLLILIKPKIMIQSEQEEEAFPTFAAPP